MNPDHGVWYGIAFDSILVGGLVFFFWLQERLSERTRRRNRRPPTPGAAAALLRRMRRLAQPTFLLVSTQEPGFSKLGGEPELPGSMEWPTEGGRSRTFVAQIELGVLRDRGGPEWLNREGRFYVFVDETRYGFADVVRIIRSIEPPAQARAAPTGTPKPFGERRVAFETYVSVPSLEWLGVDLHEVGITTEELDELSAAPDAPFSDEIQHRIGGYPSEIQDERMAISCELMHRGLPSEFEGTEITPAIERASKQWRLLLQIDSDPALKMNWGDGGRLYVFIREKDALAGDFSRTVTLWQTY